MINFRDSKNSHSSPRPQRSLAKLPPIQSKSWVLNILQRTLTTAAVLLIAGCAGVLGNGSDGNHTSPPYGLNAPILNNTAFG